LDPRIVQEPLLGGLEVVILVSLAGAGLMALVALLIWWFTTLPWVQQRRWLVQQRQWLKDRERMVHHFRKHFRCPPEPDAILPPPFARGGP
jgi:hypothetical protein